VIESRGFKENAMLRTKFLVLTLLAVSVLAMPTVSSAQISVGVAIHIGPPALPVYEQPVCPTEGYLWTPGYWAYGPDGYYWVPGTWVQPPEIGVLWTPGYWGWGGGGYLWHAGYWGPHVGFYGGINYGFGYGGVGFYGGEWRGRNFAYNTAVVRVNTTVIHNTYIDRTVIRNTTINRVSYNGGNGGINARPNAEQERAGRERHFAANSEQIHHEEAARNDRDMRASFNHGRPTVAATARPGDFHGNGATPARDGGFNANRSMADHSVANHSVPRPNQPAGFRPNDPQGDRGVQNRNIPRPSANAERANYDHANNDRSNNDRSNNPRATNVPRPPNNVRPNGSSANDRSNNDRPNNDRSNNERTNNYRSNQSPNMNNARASNPNTARPSAPRPETNRTASPQPNRPAQNERSGGGHSVQSGDRR
jgi:hypothetical protein